MVASEIAPWAKTGGLADVLAGLPAALDRLGHSTTVVVPRYRGVELPAVSTVSRRVTVGAAARDVGIHTADISERQRVVFVDCPEYFDRDGFYAAGGHEFPDNAARFALLSVAALDLADADAGAPFDIVHAHDWQAGLLPFLLRNDPRRWPRLSTAGLVFTIHNLAYQGLFPRETVPALGLSWDVFRVDGGEFWGQLSFLKTGLQYSDVVTTVSPAYARETLQAEFGCGMNGALSARAADGRYVGILNGIDTDVWNPATDPALPARYGAGDLAGKRACKRALLERFRLPVGDDALARPLVGMVSRLVDQKGLDLIADARAELVALDAGWVFVGAGDARHEAMLRGLAAGHPTRVGAFIGFDERLAHLVEAGSDLFLMPSRFEPCGLNQMYSLRYGTVPVVRAVGGLDDTVQPYTSRARKATGFKFAEATPEALVRAVRQAVRLFHDDREAWTRLQQQGMAEDHGWATSAKEYVKVYKRARLDASGRGTAAAVNTQKG
jgi:starch synthase